MTFDAPTLIALGTLITALVGALASIGKIRIDGSSGAVEGYEKLVKDQREELDRQVKAHARDREEWIAKLNAINTTHNAEIERLKTQYEEQIRKLQEQIRQLEALITELRQQLSQGGLTAS